MEGKYHAKTHLAAHDAKPMSGINAKERTTASCPEKVRIILCCCHSLIVLSAEPIGRHDKPKKNKRATATHK
jgi:hypothetical protein